MKLKITLEDDNNNVVRRAGIPFNSLLLMDDRTTSFLKEAIHQQIDRLIDWYIEKEINES